MLDYAPAPFTVRDIVAIGRGIWWSLNGRIDRIAAAEAARFFPEALRGLYLTPEASENLVLPDATGTDDATGSNNWALAGARTASGLPILCGDPHQPFWVPSSWYEFALHGPEDHAAGAGHPGLPGMWWGSNGTAAWASPTTPPPPATSMWRRSIRATRSRYRDGDAWRPFDDAHGRKSRCAARPPAGSTVRETRARPDRQCADPAVAEGGDPPLSLRWVGAEHIDDMRAAITLSRARDWAGVPRRPCATGRSRCSTSSMPTARGTSAIRWRDASRCAAASCRGFATPASRPTSGSGYIAVRRPAAQRRSAARLRRQRQPADRAAGRSARHLWRLFAGPSRRAHRPGARRQRAARSRRQHKIAERRQELPRRAAGARNPAASRR